MEWNEAGKTVTGNLSLVVEGRKGNDKEIIYSNELEIKQLSMTIQHFKFILDV